MSLAQNLSAKKPEAKAHSFERCPIPSFVNGVFVLLVLIAMHDANAWDIIFDPSAKIKAAFAGLVRIGASVPDAKNALIAFAWQNVSGAFRTSVLLLGARSRGAVDAWWVIVAKAIVAHDVNNSFGSEWLKVVCKVIGSDQPHIIMIFRIAGYHIPGPR